jgi:chromosomal replication initiator protein
MNDNYCAPCTEHPLKSQTRILTPQEIIEIVSKEYDLPVNVVCGKTRYRNIVEARMVTAYLLRCDRYLSLSLKQIGKLLGNRDHTTIMHAVHLIQDLMDVEPTMVDKVRKIFIKVYGNLNYYK